MARYGGSVTRGRPPASDEQVTTSSGSWIKVLTIAEVTRAFMRRPTGQGTLLELRGRPTADGTRAFFVNLHALLRDGRRSVFGSQPWLAVEIARGERALRYQVWIPHRERDLVERLLRACYPDLELVPAPTASFTQPAVAVAELGLALGRYLPIQTRHMPHPLAGLLVMLAAAQRQDVLVQLPLSPSVAWTPLAHSD